ncbi:MAG: hypothetical protein QG600_553, partial [Patescibacteria group bacterium]|nr:hypothetical protein [Patescibacteria group bacterium]
CVCIRYYCCRDNQAVVATEKSLSNRKHHQCRREVVEHRAQKECQHADNDKLLAVAERTALQLVSNQLEEPFLIKKLNQCHREHEEEDDLNDLRSRNFQIVVDTWYVCQNDDDPKKNPSYERDWLFLDSMCMLECDSSIHQDKNDQPDHDRVVRKKLHVLSPFYSTWI